MAKIANLKNLEGETVYPKTIAQAVIGLPSLSESNHIYIDTEHETPSTNPSDFVDCAEGDIYIYQENNVNQKAYLLTFITMSQGSKVLLKWSPLEGSSVDPASIASDASFQSQFMSETSFLSSIARYMGNGSILAYNLTINSWFMGSVTNYVASQIPYHSLFQQGFLASSAFLTTLGNNSYLGKALGSSSHMLGAISSPLTSGSYLNGLYSNTGFWYSMGGSPAFQSAVEVFAGSISMADSGKFMRVSPSGHAMWESVTNANTLSY